MDVIADGEGIVSHAGLALLRGLVDKTGLTAGQSRALAGARLVVHDWRGGGGFGVCDRGWGAGDQ